MKRHGARVAKIALFVSVVGLGACTSTTGLDLINFEETRDYQDMYLRGTISWWEASEQFKFVKVDPSTYELTIELIADGQPYDFKIADADWSPRLSCGFEYESQAIDLYEKVELACEDTSQNVKFVPAETGLFTFIFDISDNSEPELVIKRAQN
ncbi:hypothetical protein ISG33_14735 [Glaciecola sp. MH2013]|uniref:hypothetical protein n=1 Tax=Glaciecola sp. MH2013 TaxID=2785524 RepID=UPI00189DD7AC|nr:hypothetical protein [Glaciecola sp. MH2013]MBF7074660.1 hypothetical protein [Glaciecola sp. MH2013]